MFPFARLLVLGLTLLTFFVSTAFSQEKLVASLLKNEYMIHPTQGSRSFPLLKYTILDGYFKQSDRQTDDRTYDPLSDSFGLLYPGKDRWRRFSNRIALLNRNAPSGVSYKVLYLARHGQGQHNVAEHHYGPEAWECYWAMQGHNDTYRWGPDARLTSKGIAEVHRTRDAWKHELSYHIPLPESHYVSPLSRSLSTLVETWETIQLDPPRPLVNELLRETLSLHYGDYRSTASDLRQRYPQVDFPADGTFPEEDPLWNYHRESLEGRNARIKHAMDMMLMYDNNTYISMTSHSGVINSTLVALGHRPYNLQTAGMIPIIVKVERDLESAQGRTWWQPNTPWKHNEEESPEVVEKSVCPGYPPVKVSGLYENGMGVWPWS